VVPRQIVQTASLGSTLFAVATLVVAPPGVTCVTEPSRLIAMWTGAPFSVKPQSEAIPTLMVATASPGPFRIWSAPAPIGIMFSSQ